MLRFTPRFSHICDVAIQSPRWGKEIVNVLFFSRAIKLAQYDTGDAGLWLGMSDHRPLAVSFAGLPTKDEFSSTLHSFRPDRKQLHHFLHFLQESFIPTWVSLDGSLLNFPDPTLTQCTFPSPTSSSLIPGGFHIVEHHIILLLRESRTCDICER